MASKLEITIAEHADEIRYDAKERGGLFMGRVMIDKSEGITSCLYHTRGAYEYLTAKEAEEAAKAFVKRAINAVSNIPVVEEEVVEEEPEPDDEPEKLAVGDTITLTDEETGDEISGEVTKIGTKYAYLEDSEGNKHKVSLADLED